MYCNVLKYLLIEELHPAVRAGFDYIIDVSEDAVGITIQMSGFGEKLPVGIRFSMCWRSYKYNFDLHKFYLCVLQTLLIIITKHIVHLASVSKNLFEVIKTQQLKAYYNKFMETEEFIKYHLFIILSIIATTIKKFL